MDSSTIDIEKSNATVPKLSAEKQRKRILMRYTLLLPSVSLLLIALDYFIYIYQISSSGTASVETLQLTSAAHYPFKQWEATTALLLFVVPMLVVNFITRNRGSLLGYAMKSFFELILGAASLAILLSSASGLSWTKIFILLYIFISSIASNIVLLKIIWQLSKEADNTAMHTARPKRKKMISKVHIVRKPDGTLVKKTRMVDSRKQSQKYRRVRKPPRR